MFENIDFKSGKIHFKTEALEEDMLILDFPNEISVFAGFTNKFYIEIIRDSVFNCPACVYIAENTDEFLYMLPLAINKAEKLSDVNKPYYGALWKTEYFRYSDLEK